MKFGIMFANAGPFREPELLHASDPSDPPQCPARQGPKAELGPKQAHVEDELRKDVVKQELAKSEIRRCRGSEGASQLRPGGLTRRPRPGARKSGAGVSGP